MKCSINRETGNVEFSFDDNVPALQFNPDKATDDAAIRAQQLGWLNKLKDMAALPRERVVNGEKVVVTITEQMRHDAIATGIKHFEGGGAWEVRVAKPAAQNPSVAKLAERLGITYEAAMAKLAEAALAEMSAE